MYIALCSRDDCVDYHINIALSCVHTCSLHIHTICLTFLLYITTTLLGSPEFTCASMWKSMWNSCPCCCFTSFWRSCMYAYIYIYICPHLPTVYYHKWMNLLFSISYTCIFLCLLTAYCQLSHVDEFFDFYLIHVHICPCLLTSYCQLSHVDEFIDFYLTYLHLCPCLPTAYCHMWMSLSISIS